MAELRAEIFYQAHFRHAEAPAWSSAESAIFWVNIEDGEVHRYHLPTRAHSKLSLDPPVSLVIPGSPLIVSSGTNICRLDPELKILRPIVRLNIDRKMLRFNDGKLDPRGRLWLGTMAQDEKSPIATLYRLDSENALTPVLEGVVVSNGLAWSDGAMFFIDSGRKTVDAFEYDPDSGTIELRSRRTLVDFGSTETPDGMTVDREGNLWIAIADGKRVGCYDMRTGVERSRVTVDAAMVTSCCFGGGDLDLLFITTGRGKAETHQPEASGSIFVAKPGVHGTEQKNAFALR